MSDELAAGLISAVVVLLVAVITTVVSMWTTRKQLKEAADVARKERMSATLVTALGYFTGGSQNRSVGIAAIRGLQEKWVIGTEYRDTLVALLRGQLLYLLAHGSNRWESHEVGNIQAMVEMYLDLESRGSSSHGMKQLADAMDRYRLEWDHQGEPEVPGGRANKTMVIALIGKMSDWKKELGQPEGAAVSESGVSEPQADSLQMEYQEVCRSHAAITDFRAKLLALLPVATGVGVGALTVSSRNLLDIEPQLLIALGIFGAIVTFGLFLYEVRQIDICKQLRNHGFWLENELQIKAGQFGGRRNRLCLTSGLFEGSAKGSR
jgi:hypothetical protein